MKEKYMKKRQMRLSHAAQSVINKRYFGDEPSIINSPTNSELSKILNWYEKMCTKKDAREYLINYLTNKEQHENIKKLEKVTDTQLPNTLCWISRLLMREAVLDKGSIDSFETSLKELFNSVNISDTSEDNTKNVISIQDRVKRKKDELIGDIEELIDIGKPFSLYEYLQKNNVPAVYASAIISKYTEWLGELIDAYKGKDVQLIEAYSYMTRIELKSRIMFFSKLLEEANNYAQVSKITRQPRASTVTNMESNKLKFMNPLKESSEFKLASQPTKKLLGAAEVWLFNVEYNTLTVLRAQDTNGLDVSRTSVINVDETKSQTKRIGRRLDFLPKLLTGPKMFLKKEFESITSKGTTPLQTRVNENTIIVKIFT
jgi:hypothetical protein